MTSTINQPTLDADDACTHHPSDMLFNLIVTLLAPMFLALGGGNVAFARMAAAEAISEYRIRTQADLLTVAQIVGFGLAALGSLSQSMTDNLTLNMTLRLRSNAIACHRSAERNRRALAVVGVYAEVSNDPATRGDPNKAPAEAAAEPAVGLDDPAEMQNLMTTPAKVSPRVPSAASAAARTPRATTDSDAALSPHTPPAPDAGSISPQELDAIWAAAMTTVAGELTGGLHTLPPAERHLASMKAAAMNSCARDLLSGNPGPGLQSGGAVFRMPSKRR